MKEIPLNAFRFCKVSIAVMIWCSFAFREEILLILVFAFLLLSAILKISRAPLILFYSYTFEKLFPSKSKEVNETAMRFAHILGAGLSAICLLVVYNLPSVGWWVVLGFAVLKTISTLGFCPGEALYTCYTEGSCSVLKSD